MSYPWSSVLQILACHSIILDSHLNGTYDHLLENSNPLLTKQVRPPGVELRMTAPAIISTQSFKSIIAGWSLDIKMVCSSAFVYLADQKS